MSNWTTFYGWFYTQALRLCPRGFRVDFGHEMRAVFVQAIELHAGTGQALSILLRELEGLPGSLLRQHWLTIRKQQDPMHPWQNRTISRSNSANPEPGGRLSKPGWLSW